RCFHLKDINEESMIDQILGPSGLWKQSSSVVLVEEIEKKQNAFEQMSNLGEDHCPNPEMYLSLKTDYNYRSLSPWSYRIDFDENRYPAKLAFAECLCSGCIDAKSKKWTNNMNSVVLEQSMMVLRRKVCPYRQKLFKFDIDYIKVPVGCTCVLPNVEQ
uniref:Interleukin 17C n=1 Tax=Latimeria chalumnae TaxID=7897 RepID=H3AKQ5_LATCH